MNIKNIEISRRLAFLAHNNQKYGNKPYSFHLEEVSSLVKKYVRRYFSNGKDHNKKTIDIISASFLHDSLEDTNLKFSDILCFTNNEIANYVELLTNSEGKNKREITINTLKKMKKSKEAVFIKLCDRICNMRNSKKNLPSLFKKYKEDLKVYNKELHEYKKDFPELFEIINNL